MAAYVMPIPNTVLADGDKKEYPWRTPYSPRKGPESGIGSPGGAGMGFLNAGIPIYRYKSVISLEPLGSSSKSAAVPCVRYFSDGEESAEKRRKTLDKG